MLIRAYGANQCFIQMYTSGQNKMEKGKKIKFSVELNANWVFLWLCSLGWDLFIFLFVYLFTCFFFHSEYDDAQNSNSQHIVNINM